MGDEHRLHKVIGNCINNNVFPDCRIIKDEACDTSNGKHQHIPLFSSLEKSNQTEYCNVDILIIKDKEIRVIIEIEESDVLPTQVCGKFLTSALSTHYIHETEDNPVPMANSVSFLQILSTKTLPKGSSKTGQWDNLEKSIQDILPVNNIGNYKLLYGDIPDFEDGNNEKYSALISFIRTTLVPPILPI